jgi:hypothetical protein
MGKEFKTVMEAGVVGSSLEVSSTLGGVLLSGQFGVFLPGRLEARLFDKHGAPLANVPLQAVSPSELVDLHAEIKVPAETARVSLHVIDSQGKDQGLLGEAQAPATARSL